VSYATSVTASGRFFTFRSSGSDGKLSKGPPEIDDERGDKSPAAARDFDVRRARGIPTLAPLDAIAFRDNLPSSPARPAPSCQDWLAMGLQS
jgi:hypothetical protein